jgi:hypothetical protein
MASSKHGWEWASAQALDTYRLILMENSFRHSGINNDDDIVYRVDLADEIIRLEGRIPNSLQVAVDLGAIYSTAAAHVAAAANTAHEEKTIDEYLARAHEAWCIASKHFQDDGSSKAATEYPSTKALYRTAYFQIACEIGFAKYLRSSGMDVSSLLSIKQHWLRARRETPDHPTLLAIGAELEKVEAIAAQTIEIPEPSSAPAETALQNTPRRHTRPPRRQSAALAFALIATVGLATYGYRALDRFEINAIPNAMDSSSDVQQSTSRDVPLEITLVEAQSTEIDLGRMLNNGSSKQALAVVSLPSEHAEPQLQHKNDNSESRPIHIADSVSDIASRPPASAGGPAHPAKSDASASAAQFERLAYQALVAGDFAEAQKLFRASENASHGFRYSYEWTRLLAARRSDLQTADGRKAVLRLALSKDYLKFAPDDVRDKLRELAE